jgi:cell fate regulator YaaT (PSP1 superfamily)
LTYEYENYIEAAKGMPPVGSTVMTPSGLGKVCFIQFLNNSVAVKYEDGKIKEFPKEDLEMVDADVNVDIEVNRISSYNDTDEKVDARQLKQLEDDRNSSTGNV